MLIQAVYTWAADDDKLKPILFMSWQVQLVESFWKIFCNPHRSHLLLGLSVFANPSRKLRTAYILRHNGNAHTRCFVLHAHVEPLRN